MTFSFVTQEAKYYKLYGRAGLPLNL